MANEPLKLDNLGCVYEAACKLFLENDIENTTTVMPVRKSGVSLSSINRYFTNKNDATILRETFVGLWASIALSYDCDPQYGIFPVNNNSFWDPKSMDTLLFSSYVGGAYIYECRSGKIEFLRATEKYDYKCMIPLVQPEGCDDTGRFFTEVC